MTSNRMSFEEWMDELCEDHKNHSEEEQSKAKQKAKCDEFRKQLINAEELYQKLSYAERWLSCWLDDAERNLSPSDLSFNGKNGRILYKALTLEGEISDFLCNIDEMDEIEQLRQGSELE